MKYKLPGIVLLTICVIFFSCACSRNPKGNGSMNSTPEEVDVVLTQRQKDILEQMQLPKDYDELTAIQKSAIMAIEDMLSYLENKYNDTFSYTGYYETSSAAEEHLTAECSVGEVTVFRSYIDGEYTYSDNYKVISSGPRYSEAISDYIGKSFSSGTYKVFAVVNSLDDSEKDLLRAASATIYVFFDHSVIESTYEGFVYRYSEWLREQSGQHATVTKFFLLRDDGLDDIYDFNYEDMILEPIYTEKMVCSISDTGEINIF